MLSSYVFQHLIKSLFFGILYQLASFSTAIVAIPITTAGYRCILYKIIYHIVAYPVI